MCNLLKRWQGKGICNHTESLVIYRNREKEPVPALYVCRMLALTVGVCSGPAPTMKPGCCPLLGARLAETCAGFKKGPAGDLAQAPLTEVVRAAAPAACRENLEIPLPDSRGE